MWFFLVDFRRRLAKKLRLGFQICHWTLYTYLENRSKNTTTNNSSLKTRLNHWVESRGIARGANLRRTPLHLWWRDKPRGRDRNPRKTVDHNYLRKCFEILLLLVEARSSHCCIVVSRWRPQQTREEMSWKWTWISHPLSMNFFQNVTH